MKRDRLSFLENWYTSTSRRPLIIRGARQVGKTWLVRKFAEKSKLHLIELNFEKNPHFLNLFASNDPKEILLIMGAALNQTIVPKQSLLFLDEIQATPILLSKLRWFAEELPELALIATGSLLEFVLSKHTFSMPVGRINYMHLEPLSFEEFLTASDQHLLRDFLSGYDWKQKIPVVIHDKLMSFLKEYILIGGMPAAVLNWHQARSLQEIEQIHFDLLATFRDDFTKYHGRLAVDRLDDVMKAVPGQLGEKFIYSKVTPGVDSTSIKKAFELLTKAKICHRVVSSSANGVPLGAEANEKYFKALFLDVGLCSASLGLNFDQLTNINELILINSGGISEQLVGQLLRTITPPYVEPELFYWQREQKGSSAEIDYLIQHGSEIIPIEVKAGKTGGLKSLHLFVQMKQRSLALRINSDLPSETEVQVTNSLGHHTHYKLLSIPFYLVGQIHRLLKLAEP